MEQKYQSPNNPLVSRSMYITYLVLLYLGLLLLIIGILILADGNVDESLPWIVTGVLMNIAASILMLVMLYRFWDFVIPAMNVSGLTPSIDTVGKAIGYLFIPIYNFYWIFQAYGKLPKDLNALAEHENIANRLPENEGNIIAALVVIGVIPYVGYVTSFISAFILLPIFLRAVIRQIEGLPVTGVPAGSAAMERGTKTLPDLESIHDHTIFFDTKQHGINIPVGIALFLGLLASHLIWEVGSTGMLRGFFMMFTRYYLPLIISDVIMVAVFLVMIHAVRKEIVLFTVYGLIIVLLGLLKMYVFSLTMRYSEEMAANSIMLPRMINTFLYAAFFMAGVIYSIRYLGMNWWTIGAGLIVAYIASYLLSELVGLTMGSGFFFSFRFLIIDIIGYAIQGTAIWCGIRYYAIKKGITAV